MLKKWYRGHEGDVDALENFGVIWLTTNPYQAETYGEQYENGVVSEITVDMSKLNLPKNLYNGFDVWEPGWEEFRYLEELGCNGYIFNIDDVKCLALISKDPVVNVSLYKDIYGTMKSDNIEKIDLNEIKYMVKESIKRVLNNQK
jgi:hypothetical protein